jgi:hypothetical protein
VGKRGSDGRNSTPKRFKLIVSALKRESGAEKQSHAEAALIDVAALALLRLEQVKSAVLRGDADVNDEDLVRLMNAATRALTALGAGKRRKPPGDTLADHLAKIKAKAKP